MDKNKVKELQTAFNGFFKEERHYNVIKARADGDTLADIGESFNVTKERIRQMEQLSAKKISLFLNQNEVLLIDILCDNSIILKEKAEHFFGKDLWEIVKYVIRNSKNINISDWCHFSESDIYINVDADSFYTDLEDAFENAKNEKEPILFMLNKLEKRYSFLNDQHIKDYITNQGWFVFQNKLFKGKITITIAVVIIAEKYFPRGVNISSETEMQQFVDYLNNEFKNQSINCKTGRALNARIQESMILCDNATYCAPETIRISKELLIEIADYISNQKTKTTYENVFNKFENKLVTNTNINNDVFLHGVLKYFEKELEIKCSKCYVSGLHAKEDSTQDYYQELTELLLKEAKPMSIENLLEKLPNFSKLDIGYVIQNYFEELVRWDKDVVINLKSIPMSVADKTEIKKAIKKIMDKNKKVLNYASSYTLYNELKTNKKIDLSKYFVKNEKNLYQLVQYNLKDSFDFFRPHILEKGEFSSFNMTTLIDIVLDNQELISKKETYSTLYALYGGENNSLILGGQRRISEKYFRVDIDKYCLKTLYPSDETFAKDLESWVRSKLIKGHVFLPNMVDYSHFDNNLYVINNYSISDIVKHYKLPFTVTPPEGTVYNTNHDVIVDNEFKFKNKKEIFIWLCNHEIEPPRTENKVYEYAQTLGIFPINITKKDFITKMENSEIPLIED